ncbi:UDP-glycosyltransferase 87A1-like [Carya illinoinensis]|uniref:Uncharacterized protein n=1 Tax=Carya illinoinensis TaxID=32201 RepID=A0A8T1NQG7_CARIL|nr:UDP-glycosyltransferase 87A1-like [Carya illinoinensis]KAG6631153.1 hypothetical protein CIPAW_13G070900 [Carya illinoinensis]
MDPTKKSSTAVCHVVAMPYPGRGHINPMMNLCKQLVLKSPSILVTFVVTEEWLGFIGGEPKLANIRFATIPNVIPSEIGRAKDFPRFIQAVNTTMEAPFEELLDRLEHPVSAIVADTYVIWVVRVGNRRNIPVASLMTMSATVFSVLHHFELLVQNGHFPVELSECGDELVDYIPGVPTTRLADLPTFFSGDGLKVLPLIRGCILSVSKAQYLLFTSVHELEAQVIDILRAKLSIPVYPIGPSIPYLELQENASNLDGNINGVDYFHWLDSQPIRSVLYISFGSLYSVSDAQMDEIVDGVRDSGIRCLWVSRGNTTRFKDGCGDMGFVVPWCDQLKVLCHSSIGGFWTHCGWNSTLEGVFAGLPMLTSPIFFDQVPNSKRIVENWKIGWRIKKDVKSENLVTRGEISDLLKRFMNQENNEGFELRKRAKELQDACHRAIAEGGSTENNLQAFITDITRCGH